MDALHIMHKKQREALGDDPKCPDCNTPLGESILVPWWLVCEKCETLLSPDFGYKKKLSEVWKTKGAQ